MPLRDAVARAIYEAAFIPGTEDEASRKKPSPGWCWEKTSEEHREFARRQADAALAVIGARK